MIRLLEVKLFSSIFFWWGKQLLKLALLRELLNLIQASQGYNEHLH